MDHTDRTWMQRQIDVLIGEVRSMTQQVQELNEKMAEKDVQIASRDDTISDLLEDEMQWRRQDNYQKRVIRKLQLELSEKLAIIRRQDSELDALKGRVCNFKNGWLQETRQLMQEIACASDTIGSRDREIENLKGQIECHLDDAANERRELQKQLRYKDKQLVALDAEKSRMEAAESVAEERSNHEQTISEKDRQIEELEVRIAQMRENASEKDRIVLEQVDMMTGKIDKLDSELIRQKEESESKIASRDHRLIRVTTLLLELEKSNRDCRKIVDTINRSRAELQLEFDTLQAQYVFLESKSQEAELNVIRQLKKKMDAVKLEKEQAVKSFQDILKNRVRMYNRLKRAHDDLEDKRDAYETRAKIVERLEYMVEALGFDSDGHDFYFWVNEDDDEPEPSQLELVPGTKMSLKHRDKAIANLRNALSEKDRELRKTKRKLNRDLYSTKLILGDKIDRLTTKLEIAEGQCRDLRLAIMTAEAETPQDIEMDASREAEDEAESLNSGRALQMPGIENYGGGDGRWATDNPRFSRAQLS